MYLNNSMANLKFVRNKRIYSLPIGIVTVLNINAAFVVTRGLKGNMPGGGG